MARLETLQPQSGFSLLHAGVRHVALVGNYPPRRCGIATFTADLRAALKGASPTLRCDVYAMSEKNGSRAYPPEVAAEIEQNAHESYVDAARRINASGAELVCIQHEFGIFGGEAGENVLLLFDLVRAPIVVTLHAVLERPDALQRNVIDHIRRKAAKIVVMAEKGKDLLTRIYGVAEGQIDVIPHGAPDWPLSESAPFKENLNLAGRRVLLTFGLLSPGKGIEHMVRAMPEVARACPDALYVVLGATHPNLVATEGEAYREGLVSLATELGVAANVRFIDMFVTLPQLLEYLAAADLYVTPYLNEAQITSGTLAYAVALGKPVVSTPYWHAQEFLSDGAGALVAFGDGPALASACAAILGDETRREAMRQRAYAKGRATIWSNVAETYLRSFALARRAVRPLPQPPVALPTPSIAGLKRMSDEQGMLQHGANGAPDRAFGYCVDDNARALILIERLSARGNSVRRLENTFASFIERSWNPGARRFRNFMDGEGCWLEEEGSCDSFGRTFWSLGVAARLARASAMRAWARTLAERALETAQAISAPRALSFVVLGLDELAAAGAFEGRSRGLLAEASLRLFTAFAPGHQDGAWCEPYLAYDNARLPQALLRAGLALDVKPMIAKGLAALEWLCGVQSAPRGWFRPVGSRSLGKAAEQAFPYDQQPLEAAATIDACSAAFEASGDERWIAEALRAFDWFRGVNDVGASLIAPEEGLCYDGLTMRGPNLNSGAESILSLQLAILGVEDLLAKAAGPRPLIARRVPPAHAGAWENAAV